jgi:hypothetical protein
VLNFHEWEEVLLKIDKKAEIGKHNVQLFFRKRWADSITSFQAGLRKLFGLEL